MSTNSTPQLTIKQRLAAASAALTTGQDVQANLTKLQGEHELATAEIDRVTKALAASESLAATRGTELTTANETIAAHVKTIATHETTIKDLTAKVESLPKQVGNAVTEKLSEIGVPAEKAPKAAEATGKTANEHVAKYQELQATNPSAAAAYFAANREKILT